VETVINIKDEVVLPLDRDLVLVLFRGRLLVHLPLLLDLRRQQHRPGGEGPLRLSRLLLVALVGKISFILIEQD
jgi:hypothetical protein